MKLVRVLAASCLLVLGALAWPEVAPELAQTANRLASSILTGGYMSTLEQLTSAIGPRVTGSPAYDHAVDWAAEQFRAAGLSNVHFETFTIPNGWERGPAQARILFPVERTLHIEPVGWSPATSSTGVTAPVVLLDDLSPDAIRNDSRIRDHVLLLDSERYSGDDSAALTPALLAALPLLEKAGARGVLLPDRVPNNVLGDWADIGYGAGKILPLPAAEIGLEDN